MDDDTSFSSDVLLTKPSAAGPGELQQVIQEQIQEDYKEIVANDLNENINNNNMGMNSGA